MKRIQKSIAVFLIICALALPLAALANAATVPSDGKESFTTPVDPKTPTPTTKPTSKPTQAPTRNPKSVKLDRSGTVEMEIGDTLQLNATVSPKGAKKKLKWSSSDKKVATVDKNGLVTAVDWGVATITVKTHNNKKASVKVGVCAVYDDGDVNIRLNHKGVMIVSGWGTVPKFGGRAGEIEKWKSEIREVTIRNGINRLDDLAFWGLENLQKVTVPGSVKWIGPQAFSYCYGLKTVKLGKGVQIIEEWAFASDPSLKSITVPGTVEELWNGAFQECENLKSVRLSKGLRVVGSYTFYKDSSLRSIVIPRGVTIVDYDAFHDCTRLREVELPKGLETLGTHVFMNCPALKYVVIPRSVTSIGGADDSYEDNIFGTDGSGRGKTIFGYRGSEAQSYAEQCQIKFVAVG